MDRSLYHNTDHHAVPLQDLAAGFDWVIEQLSAPADDGELNAPAAGLGSRGAFPNIAMELEIAKGISFLRQKNIPKAIEVFKSFETRDGGLFSGAGAASSDLWIAWWCS